MKELVSPTNYIDFFFGHGKSKSLIGHIDSLSYLHTLGK